MLQLSSTNPNEDLKTSILNLKAQYDSPNTSIEEKIEFSRLANQLAVRLENDSLKLRTGRDLGYFLMVNGEYKASQKVQRTNLQLAIELKDSISLGYVYNNMAFNFQNLNKIDSSYYCYYKGIQLYEKNNLYFELANSLINVADIQNSNKDFFAAEESLIKSIELLEDLPKSEGKIWNLWRAYDALGSNSIDFGNYEKSLEFYDKAIEIIRKNSFEGTDYIYTINNKANSFRQLKNYDKSISLYLEALSHPKLRDLDPSIYGLILDNLAQTKFLNKDSDLGEIEELFWKSLAIHDSINDVSGKLAVSIDLANYYYETNTLDSSKYYAQNSYKIAKQISENDLLLESMVLLSKLTEGGESRKYLDEYVTLNDSLLARERAVRNKFARIEFETDQIEKEKDRVTQQRSWLLAISLGLALTAILIYIIITQRNKNRELQYIQDQQKANEEIYNLMLTQQDKVDEARATEKKRISQELHDGILGRLFGTRLTLDSLNFNQSTEAVNSRSQYISELKTIEEDIRKISHELNTDFVAGSGFIGILEELIKKQTAAYRLNFEFDYTEEIHWELVPNKLKINLYRIIQESLQNIYKHAEANKVGIGISLENDVICLTVEDDGKGFDVSKGKRGIGIKNINSRVDEIGGEVMLQSEINKGTKVEVKVPYSKIENT
ncbi:ATP-binding protein [Aegicerativicinus sediminis]|uniref:ATP-binding protein n=1 Tax=Aegicerativicinus sediminis TaxID=2893202 RepID=UPI001E2E4593|nr:tetratricopeptide repeat-containing sensor histidine kinase [Aegicerativicinus sediminis]